MNESGADEGECSRKVASGRRVAGAITVMINARSLQLERGRVMHESLLMHVLYGSETMIWREERSRRLYKRTTSEVCWVSELIKSRMHR